MKRTLLATLMASAVALSAIAANVEPGFTSITDGKSFKGWKMATEHTNTWIFKDGAFVAQGERSHLYYVGDPKPFKNFELKVDVKTAPMSNGGIYFHTKYQAESWPKYGFETQVNNTHGDWKKTGSLYDINNVKESAAKDNEWWTQTITVKGNKVTVKVNDKVVMEYIEPSDAKAGKDYTRKLDEGTFALQAHDPKSVIHYKNIRVKRLE
ncbi:MAG: DUF1080 domain-containing protein [Verrucomicrobia bacterium]|jgi:hypothetical protein|nr:DUF1080 domain-containing protein [Verrucomicrobiota bacterium]